jgi:hypothetical protein
MLKCDNPLMCLVFSAAIGSGSVGRTKKAKHEEGD